MTFMRNIGISILSRWPIRFALLIIAAAGIAKWQSSWLPTDVVVPVQALPAPSPNARDYFTDAGKLIRGPVDLAVYANPGGTPQQRADITSGYHVFTLAETDKLVAENLPAFQKLKQGLKFQYIDKPYRSLDQKYPPVYYRKLARAMKVAGADRGAHGDWNGAANYYIESMELGSDITHGSDLTGLLVSFACEAIGRNKGASTIVDHLDAEQAEAAAQRIAALDSGRSPLYAAITKQRISGQAILLQYFKKPNWRQALLDDSDAVDSPNTVGYFGWMNRLGNQANPVDLNHHDFVDSVEQRLESPRMVYANYTTQMFRAAVIAKNGGHTWSLPTDLADLEVLPDLSTVYFKYSYDAAMDRLLETRLALRAYRLQNGGYPASLDELAPRYLPKVPVDPFSNNQPLKYRTVGVKYGLYSIGPDRVDDGGKPVYNPQLSGNKYAGWVYNEKGDIVAGINEG